MKFKSTTKSIIKVKNQPINKEHGGIPHGSPFHSQESLTLLIPHSYLLILLRYETSHWLAECRGGGRGEVCSDTPPPKLSLPRAKRCSAPFKTPHQHTGRECSRQHSLVLHSVTACVVQSAHVVCSELGCLKSERYTAWGTSQVLSRFSCNLISGSECS